jgi:uncharacterized Fe-S cluster protein YjdI
MRQESEMAGESGVVRTYDNGEIRVIWRPALCIHSAVCARGLPAVFDPRRRPWIAIHAAASHQITAQVDSCPSGALSWERVVAAPPPREAPSAT